MTSATTSIESSPRISPKSPVSTPPAGRDPRSFPVSRTSALTTRRRWPVARSMSSADSVSRRSTAAPTVPYPRSATGTSTDPSGLLLHIERSEPRSDLLDLRLRQLGARLVERRLAPVHLRNPLARERSVLNRLEHRPHVLTDVLVDDLRADGVRTVLRGVGDRVVHPLDPALPDQVGDQLELVQALVVGDLGLVPRLDERLEPQLDQLGDAAAEHRLLTEQIGLRLLGKRGLDHPRARSAERGPVGVRQLERA